MTLAREARPSVLVVRREDGLAPDLRRKLERAGLRIASFRGGRSRRGSSGDPLQALATIAEHLGLEGHLLQPSTLRPETAPGSAMASSGASQRGRSLFPILLDTSGLERLEIAEEGISLDAVERALLCRALDQMGWNQSRAARLLGITRQTLIYRMEKYEIERRKAP
ncbi:MAG: hypothetical protein HUU06_00920 [Planctomycetaceae bacterium]|nr:hypothetical protein [Planctomycetota bacterium]NUN51334.1 hypothetical protein [Planctomycetaceae bacterium]